MGFIGRDISKLRTNCPVTTGFMRYRARSKGLEPERQQVEWCGIESVSPLLIFAVLKLEDASFFGHHGLHLTNIYQRVYRAALTRGARIEGVSTISMQLARNLYLTPERTYARKARQVIIALQLECMLSKTRILELYLNVIEWGQDIWGVKSASRQYFDKSPRALNLFEACLLGSLIPAPLRSLTGWNRQRVQSEQNRAVCSLFLSGIVTSEECSRTLRRSARFHRLIEDGVEFRDAVLISEQACDDQPDHLAGIRMDETPLPLELPFNLQGGWKRQQRELVRLRKIYGKPLLGRVVSTGDTSILKASDG